MAASGKVGPYKASWIDRFIAWIGTLRPRVWILYFGLGVALILVQLLFLWLDRGPAAEELLPVIIFNGLAVPYLLALIHLFDSQAVAALATMKPVLTLTAQEFDDQSFRLANMPFWAPLIAGAAATVGTVLTPVVSTTPASYAALEQLPVFAILFHIVDKASAFLFGVMFYHTIRQLRLVNAITSNHTRVNLFHLGPLQAFSRLTVSTAVGLLVFVYAWMLINPELLADPVLIGILSVFTAVAVFVFVWPLWGVHKLMEMEKSRALHEIDLRFEAIFSEVNELLGEGDHGAIARLNGTIAALEVQHNRISSLPTWPWSTETARIAVTAIALPLILMIIQVFVLQALDR